MKLSTGPSDVPFDPHYEVLVYDTLTYDDGYGGRSTDRTIAQYVTQDRSEWEEMVGKLELRGQQYVALDVRARARVSKKVSVEVGA